VIQEGPRREVGVLRVPGLVQRGEERGDGRTEHRGIRSLLTDFVDQRESGLHVPAGEGAQARLEHGGTRVAHDPGHPEIQVPLVQGAERGERQVLVIRGEGRPVQQRPKGPGEDGKGVRKHDAERSVQGGIRDGVYFWDTVSMGL